MAEKTQPPTSNPQVRPGQVWADNDRRQTGRTLRIEEIVDGRARAVVLTNYTEVQNLLDNPAEASKLGYHPKDARGKTTMISLKRFVPTATGYRLVADA